MSQDDKTAETTAQTLGEAAPAVTPSIPLRRSTEPTRSSRSTGARMTVGPGIKLKGEVSDCDTLVVEGSVEATLTSEVLEVAEGGTFSGTATVTDAEVHGRFEGELTVTGVLQIRSTGHVTGTIKYGRSRWNRAVRSPARLPAKKGCHPRRYARSRPKRRQQHPASPEFGSQLGPPNAGIPGRHAAKPHISSGAD